MDFEAMARDFEAQRAEAEQENETAVAVVEKQEIAEIPQPPANGISAYDVVGGTQQEILKRAQEKIQTDKILEKHAVKIAKITDKAMAVDAERAALTVQQKDADNKTEKQEIKNRLIVLKAEAKRLRKEQKQLNIEQKAEHKARNKAAKWELYKDKLQRMKYDYVPNPFILSMLLFFDGLKSFFDGLGAVSTAIVKALKWVLLIGAILIVLFAIPVTRDWIVNILKGGI